MKTMMKTPKTCLLLLLMTILLTLGCSSDDDAPAPDPKADFVGTFEMDDFDMRIVITNSGTVDLDSIVTVTDNPEIEFLVEEGLAEGELKTELDEFMQSLWERTFSAAGSTGITVEVETGEEVIAEISDDNFTLDEFNSEVILSDGTNTEMLEFDFNGEGELEEEELSMEYEINAIVGNSTVKLTGTVVGEKE